MTVSTTDGADLDVAVGRRDGPQRADDRAGVPSAQQEGGSSRASTGGVHSSRRRSSTWVTATNLRRRGRGGHTPPGVIAGETIDLAGTTGRHVRDNLLPACRLRVGPGAVKRPLSRYACKSLRVDRRTYKATLSLDILTIPLRP